MAKADIADELSISREQMIELLNEDLAREYQAIIAYTVYSQVIKGAEYTDIARELEKHAAEELTHAIKIAKQIDYLGGKPAVVPKPVATPASPRGMLEADLRNERETVANYRQRIRQAEAMGEFALSETLRKACDLYRLHNDLWKKLVEVGMRQDWSWGRSARHYVEAYQQTIERAKHLPV